MTNPTGIRHRTGLISCLVAASASLGGCHLAVDPYRDDLAHQPAVTTASVEGVRSAQGAPSERQCAYEQTTVSAADGSVIHGPLLFEDPFVVAGSEDGQYAWTAEEYFYWLYGSAHYLLSASLSPVSLIDTPVWQPYASDGRRSGSLLGLPIDSEPDKNRTGSPQ